MPNGQRDWYHQALRVGQLANAMTSIIGLMTLALSAMVAIVTWLAIQAGLPPVVVAVLLIDLLAVLLGEVFLALIYRETRRPYRNALRLVTRDYYAEVGRLEAQLDPVGHKRPSARLHLGSADPAWAGPIYDHYGVPREDSYGD